MSLLHYLVIHSLIAAVAAIITTAGVGASVLLADLVYDVPANVILDSARRALSGYDVITSCIKAWVFGLIISTVGVVWCGSGGTRGGGEQEKWRGAGGWGWAVVIRVA